MSQPRRADGDSLPQIAALGFNVVGRRAPTCATSAPARTLNRLDLPLPVAPAKATTVHPTAIDVRKAVLAMAASARSTSAAGRHPAPDSKADVNTSALAWTDLIDISVTAPVDGSVLKTARVLVAFELIASHEDSSCGFHSSRGRLDPASLSHTERNIGNSIMQAHLLSGIQSL